jgi:hypothetical protein
MRRQSLHRNASANAPIGGGCLPSAMVKTESGAAKTGRRATVGFALPSTPAHSRPAATAAYTVVGNRRLPVMVEQDSAPSTPTVQTSLPVVSTMTPLAVFAAPIPLYQTPTTVSLQDILPNRETPITEELSSEGDSSTESPSMPDDREEPIVAAQPQPQVKSVPKQPPATPYMGGMREMFREPAAAVATPKFAGIRDMFAEKRVAVTPGMEGIAEMYDDDEDEDEVEVEEEVLKQESGVIAESGMQVRAQTPMIELGEEEDDDEEEEEEEEIEERKETRSKETDTPVDMLSAPVKVKAASRLPAPTQRASAIPKRTTATATAAVRKGNSVSAPTRTRKIAPPVVVNPAQPAASRTRKASDGPTESSSVSAPTRRNAASATTTATATRAKRTAGPAERSSAPTRLPTRAVTTKNAASKIAEEAWGMDDDVEGDAGATASETEEEEEQEVKEVSRKTSAPAAVAATTKAKAVRGAAKSAPTRTTAPAAKPVRGRKPLATTSDQDSIVEKDSGKDEAEAPVKATRGRKPAATSTTKAKTASSEEKTSAPTKRSKATTASSTVSEDKENEPVEQPKVFAKRGAAKKAAEASVAAPAPIATRATRSRK